MTVSAKKAPPQASDWIANADPNRGAINLGGSGGWVDCKYIILVAAGYGTRKWLGFDQNIRNITSGDLGIPLVAVRLGVAGLNKIKVVHLLDFRKEGRRSSVI